MFHMRRDIGDIKYSLLLDESNDISILRILMVSAIYHGNNCGKVVLTYLDLIKIDNCDAENIASANEIFCT